jgi:hypothetical protein
MGCGKQITGIEKQDKPADNAETPYTVTYEVSMSI